MGIIKRIYNKIKHFGCFFSESAVIYKYIIMEKNIFEKLLYKLTDITGGNYAEGKKTMQFNIPVGDGCTSSFALWGSKLYYETKNLENSVLNQGFINIEETESINFNAFDLSGIYWVFGMRNGSRTAVYLPYITDYSSLNAMARERAGIQNEERSEGIRKINIYVSTEIDVFSSRGAWCYAICEKDKEFITSFNVENCTDEKQLILLALISAFEKARGMNACSVNVHIANDELIQIRKKSMIAKCIDSGVGVPPTEEYSNLWNRIMGYERFYSFRFDYRKSEQDNIWTSQCSHECRIILASDVIGEKKGA